VIKLVGFLKRKSGLEPEAFQAHWREKHAPLGSRVPGLRRYVQNHTRLAGYARRQPLWDGVVELWFDDVDAFRAAWSSEEMEPVRADEPAFLDVANCKGLLAREHVVSDAPAPAGGAKLISFLSRRRDIDVAAFQEHWRERHAPIAASVPGLVRYVQCHTLPESYAGAPPIYDGVPLAWFAGTDAMRGSDGSDAYNRTREDEAHFIEPGTLGFVIAEEHVVVAGQAG